MEWPVDPRNPGEVLACAGLAHLAWRADPLSKTGFEFDESCRFVAKCPTTFLDGIAGATLEETGAGLSIAGIELDWWLDWGLNPGLKTWAGQQSALTVHRNLLQAAQGLGPEDWYDHAESTTGRLNVDVLGTWNALDMGWSLNEHGAVKMLCRPWLELLASIGLQAFPVRGRKSEGGFEYRLWRPAPLPSAVAAFGSRKPSVYSACGYRTRIGKSGSNTILRVATPA
ncbi:MAG: hypothetical protein OXH59_04445 [Rhodospirillaceae bacterium]|nr:hypothetical protein [Rhodospirillaceae bacterium]